MSNVRRSKALWAYLESTGSLHGTEEEINIAKRNYRKQYLLTYKRQQRSKRREYTIGLSVHSGEHKRIAEAAKRHRLKIPPFLKSATLAYLDQKFLVPDRLLIAHLEQLLADCLNEVKSIVTIKDKYFWQRDQKLEAIEKKILKLEHQINSLLTNPPLVASHDHQNQVTQTTSIPPDVEIHD